MKNDWKDYKAVPYSQELAPRLFLDYFYPIHFSIGMRIEQSLMSCGRLDRHQTVIMWILRSESMRNDSDTISRKEVVRLMTNWYDITSSMVSKALRGLAKEPLHYITLSEDPNSGREKLIKITPEGLAHCDRMIESATSLIKGITDQMSEDENKMGVFAFMRMDEEFSKIRT